MILRLTRRMSGRQVARLLGMRKEDVFELCRQGAFRGAYRWAGKGRWRIPRESVLEWEAKQAEKAAKIAKALLESRRRRQT